LDIGDWDLFGIWDLKFGISSAKLRKGVRDEN
jgi:hypothetical protein